MARKTSVFKKFPRTFWIANTLELFERWAWYGLFMVLALYLTKSKDMGALGFTQAQKGNIMGIVSAILYFLPIITGSIADKFGYKKVLLISFSILSSGYFLMGWLVDYNSVFMVFLFIAIGGALFKPVISATIAKTTNAQTSSIGFGIFYMMVNIGAFIGPIFASKLRELDWKYVFYMSATVILVNILLVIFFYKEPEREKSSASIQKLFTEAFTNILTALKDIRFVIFLIIIIGFWSMYLQLFFTLPVFIDQWMDTSALYEVLHNLSPRIARNIGTAQGTVNPEIITNIDALYIILFQVLISSVVMRFKPLYAMIGGIFVSATGIGLMFATNNVLFLIPSILVFAVGEMATSPKITEYIGKIIAPKDKVGLYMGASFLPMSGGNYVAGIISGTVYGKTSDKINLIRKELASRQINLPEFSEHYTKTDLLQDAMQHLQMNNQELTRYLWQQYHPHHIWMLLTGIGLATALLLMIYGYLINRKA
jgi:dipeptide/tripeptide permease